MNNKIYAALFLVSSAVHAMEDHPPEKAHVPGQSVATLVIPLLDPERFDIDQKNIFNSQARFRGQRLATNIHGPSNVKEDGTKTPSPEKAEQN